MSVAAAELRGREGAAGECVCAPCGAAHLSGRLRKPVTVQGSACACDLLRRGCAAGREVRENMFTQVAELFHDLDAGMLPVSVLFPYLPIPQHRRRDRCGPEAPLRPPCIDQAVPPFAAT